MSILAIDFSGLGPRKSVFVVIIIVGCFSILWPKIFHPMFMGFPDQQIMPNAMDRYAGCCDVIFSSDMNALMTVTNLCAQVLKFQDFNETKLLGSNVNNRCRAEILSRCGLDILPVFSSGKGGPDVKGVKRLLSEMRSLNGSSCLQVEFGIPPWTVGAGHRPRTMAVLDTSIRQERPPHLRGDLPHPAMRERGRAIPAAFRQAPPPAPETMEKPFSQPQPRLHEGRPGPIPGMRPPLGGAGHMTPAKTSSSPMGVLMPLYTIAIVIFFVYTIMKIIFKKQSDGPGLYPPLEPDPVFRRRVFGPDSILNGTPKDKVDRVRGNDSKLGESELDHLRRRLMETERAMACIVEQMGQVPLRGQDHVHLNGNIKNSDLVKSKTSDPTINSKVHGEVEHNKNFTQLDQEIEDKPTVKILGMEMTTQCEGGQKFSQPSSPIPLSAPQEPETVVAQSIYLEGTLPHQSQLLVTESETHTEISPIPEATLEDSPVILSGKMTLSVINLDNTENVESQLEANDDNAVQEDDNGVLEDDEDLANEVDLDMTDENINELEDEDIPENIESIEVVMDEDINLN
ncbi:uncharacterized protein LOC113363256 isoform X2 [Ctenocephalides felis]|uniref:uncharacterized protein LOC113363256 isoform X2 n=1 Tax=Ctenocephalides felis TaxID=7515 RepID=UPI000E6E3495|nr:uncharacterized protein LOC113363256 isoform X2 [Ctenocephalides felis]